MKTAGTSITSSFSLKRSFKRRLRERKFIQSCTIKKRLMPCVFCHHCLFERNLGDVQLYWKKTSIHQTNQIMEITCRNSHFTLNMNITFFMTFSYQSPPIDIFWPHVLWPGAPLKICKSCPAPRCDHLVRSWWERGWEVASWDRKLPIVGEKVPT